MQIIPSSVLFCCTMNALRSPMAEGLMKRYHGDRVFIDSAGLKAGAADPLMPTVMGEIGVDMTRHRPKTFTGLIDDSFDMVIALSGEAWAQAEAFARYRHCEPRLWNVPDPSLSEGTREARLAAYRHLRDELRDRILDFFPPPDESSF
jgi:protein-tyrosine-phosphatase